jgi:hypothetical protein
MGRADQTEIRMRLVIDNPVAGILHSLQDKKSAPVDPKAARSGKPLVFAFPIRFGPGPKFYGEHVRSEGPTRRFFYIAIGQQAGQKDSCWSRRMKIDIAAIPMAMLEKAAKGKVIEGAINGIAKDGSPACATVPLTKPWRVV